MLRRTNERLAGRIVPVVKHRQYGLFAIVRLNCTMPDGPWLAEHAVGGIDLRPGVRQTFCHTFGVVHRAPGCRMDEPIAFFGIDVWIIRWLTTKTGFTLALDELP